MRSMLVLAAVLAAAPATAQPAPANPRPEMAAARQACAGDLARHCAGVQPGGGRIAQCLRQNASSFTPECRSALAAARGARR